MRLRQNLPLDSDQEEIHGEVEEDELEKLRRGENFVACGDRGWRIVRGGCLGVALCFLGRLRERLFSFFALGHLGG